MSCLLYIPAGIIEIHPHIKCQLASINRICDSTLDKILSPRTDNLNALCPGKPRSARLKDVHRGVMCGNYVT